MGEVTWTAYGTHTQIITDTEPANDGITVSDEIDNTANCDRYMDIRLHTQHASAPSAGGYYAVYLVQALDGTNYADGADGSVIPPAPTLICVLPVRAVTTAQIVDFKFIPMPPSKFKIITINKTGQAASANTHQLYYRAYGESVA